MSQPPSGLEAQRRTGASSDLGFRHLSGYARPAICGCWACPVTGSLGPLSGSDGTPATERPVRPPRQPLVTAAGTSSDPSAHPALPVVPPQPAHSSSRQASWPCRRRGCPTPSRRRRPSRSPRAGPSCAICCHLRCTSLAGYTRTCALRPRSVWSGQISQREVSQGRHDVEGHDATSRRRNRRAAATPSPARGRRAFPDSPDSEFRLEPQPLGRSPAHKAHTRPATATGAVGTTRMPMAEPDPANSRPYRPCPATASLPGHH